MTHFIALFAFLWRSATEPTVSSRLAGAVLCQWAINPETRAEAGDSEEASVLTQARGGGGLGWGPGGDMEVDKGVRVMSFKRCADGSLTGSASSCR